jgi:hypothetical protein
MSANRKDIRTAANGVKMEHRHFAFIAATLAECEPGGGDYGQDEYQQWVETCRAFANACRATNPRFDLARFLSACGIEQ